MRFLHSFGDFFVNAFTRLKRFFSSSGHILPVANTGNTTEALLPGKEEQQTAYENQCFLLLPPGIRNKFFRMASSAQEVNPSLMNHAGNHSTVVLLKINHLYFWGVNNVIPTLTQGNLNDIKAILKFEKNISANAAIMLHAEADAILQAFKQQVRAGSAIMFIDRKLCRLCGTRAFNETYLRRLLPLLCLKELTVYTTSSLGKMTKLVLSPLSSGTSSHNFW